MNEIIAQTRVTQFDPCTTRCVSKYNYINPRSVLLYQQLSSKSRYFLPDHPLTSVKIVNGVAVGVEDTKAGRLVVVLVRVPEDVHLVESLAGDGAPESLGVLDGSDLLRKLVVCSAWLSGLL